MRRKGKSQPCGCYPFISLCMSRTWTANTPMHTLCFLLKEIQTYISVHHLSIESCCSHYNIVTDFWKGLFMQVIVGVNCVMNSVLALISHNTFLFHVSWVGTCFDDTLKRGKKTREVWQELINLCDEGHLMVCYLYTHLLFLVWLQVGVDKVYLVLLEWRLQQAIHVQKNMEELLSCDRLRYHHL